MGRIVIATLLLLAAAACQAPQPAPQSDGSGHSVRHQLQRLAHAEFGSKHLADLEIAAWRVPAAVRAEFTRNAADSPSWQRFLDQESRRWHLPAQTAERLVALELDRGQRGVQRLATGNGEGVVDRQSRRLIDGLAGVPAVLGLDRLPLTHPDDREFRTEPDDDLLEAGLWARIARRLPPW